MSFDAAFYFSSSRVALATDLHAERNFQQCKVTPRYSAKIKGAKHYNFNPPSG